MDIGQIGMIIVYTAICLLFVAVYKAIKWRINKKDWYILEMYGLVDPILLDDIYSFEEEVRVEVERLRELPENSQNSYTYFYVQWTGKIGF